MLEQPGLAFAGARKVYGPHLGALVVADLILRLTGAPPRFTREDEE